MIGGSAAEVPMILPLALYDGQVVDAGKSQAHQAVRVELPVLVPVAAEPEATVVVPLVREAHGDAVCAERPELLDQAVLQLAAPLAREECCDRLAALQELRAIPPAAVGRVGERDPRGIAGIPGVFREARLLRGGVG